MSDEDDRRHNRDPLTVEQLCSTVSQYKILVSSWCLQRFAYHYVHGIWGPPTPRMAFGTAFDATTNKGYAAKLLTGKNPTVEDSKAIFEEALKAEGEDIEDWGTEDLGEMIDEGVQHAEYWATETAPDVQPVAVQTYFSLAIQDWNVNGVIDLARIRTDDVAPKDAGCFVVDHKTTKKRWTVDQAAGQLQPVFYSFAALSGQLGPDVDPSRIGYEIMIRLKGGPRRQRLVVGVGDRERAFVLHVIGEQRKAWKALYEAGVWPTNRTHFMCSRRQCPHWQRCEKDNLGTVKP